MVPNAVALDATHPSFTSCEEIYMIFDGCATSTSIGYVLIDFVYEFTVQPGFAGIVPTISGRYDPGAI